MFLNLHRETLNLRLVVLSHISVYSNFQLQVQMNEIQTQSSPGSTQYLKDFTKNQMYQNIQCQLNEGLYIVFFLFFI